MVRWALISEEHSEPRLACTLETVARLRRAGVSVSGFVQRRFRRDGQHGFELLRISGGDERVEGGRIELAKKPATSSAEVTCDYDYEDGAFRRARSWIEEDARLCDCLVLDVISKMERYGRGHAGSLRLALASGKLVILCVRSSQLAEIVDEFALDVDQVVAWLELPVSEADKESFVTQVARTVAVAGAR